MKTLLTTICLTIITTYTVAAEYHERLEQLCPTCYQALSIHEKNIGRVLTPSEASKYMESNGYRDLLQRIDTDGKLYGCHVKGCKGA